MLRKIIGIDLGGTTIKIAILDDLGTILFQWSIPTNTTDGGSHIVEEIIESIEYRLNKYNIDVASIIGIGMGSPGQIDFNEGTVVGAYNLGWADKQEVKSVFQKHFSCPFFIDNDANVAALGERWKGAGENAKDVIFVTLGTGVGGGIVADGHLLHGVKGSAGEIGHMTVDPKGFECTCGNIGCLETVASATGTVNLANKMITKNDTGKLAELIREKKVTAKEIFDCAKDGDLLALRIVDEFSTYLGLSCSQLANALNPSYIVIGGGVSAAGEFLLHNIQKHFEKFAFPTVRTSTKLKLASLGNDAGVIGAASLTIN